jgi:hypothetical protein
MEVHRAMPRISAIASSLVVLQGQAPLEPPADLPEAERKVFLATVRSVKPEHFAPEDIPVLEAYCGAVVQRKIVATELAKAAEEDAEKLRVALSRANGDLVKLARACRLGPISRDVTSRRRQGTTRPGGPRPWDTARDREAG